MLSPSLDQMVDYSCVHCPILAVPMQKSLAKAQRFYIDQPECFTPELLSIATIPTVATIIPFTAEHLIRSAGAYIELLNSLSFQEFHSIFDAFRVASGHDIFKVERRFLESIALSSQNFREIGQKVLSQKELYELLFLHIAFAPKGLRIKYRDFGFMADHIFKQTMAMTANHHIAGSQNPSLVEHPERPLIKSFVYLNESETEDRTFIEKVASNILFIVRNTNSIEQLLQLGLDPYDFELHTAKLLTLFTPIDIVDAMHRRSYLQDLNWDEIIVRVERALQNSLLPKYLAEYVFKWYQSFGSLENYYFKTLSSGWSTFGSQLLQAHAETHSKGQSCVITNLILDTVAHIPHVSQVHIWLNQYILPFLHHNP